MVRATALMALFPNFAHRTFLQAVGVGVFVLKFFRVTLAHRTTWPAVTVCTTAPLLIQLAKVLSVVGLGRPNLAGPFVWLNRVLNELILCWKVLLQPFHAAGTAVVAPLLPIFLVFGPLFDVRVAPQPACVDRPGKNDEPAEVERERKPLRPLTLVAIVSISKKYNIAVAYPTLALIGTRGAPLEILGISSFSADRRVASPGAVRIAAITARPAVHTPSKNRVTRRKTHVFHAMRRI